MLVVDIQMRPLLIEMALVIVVNQHTTVCARSFGILYILVGFSRQTLVPHTTIVNKTHIGQQSHLKSNEGFI